VDGVGWGVDIFMIGLPNRYMRIALVLLALALILTPALAEPTARNLGTPIRAMSIRESLLVKDPVTGRPTYYSGMYTSRGTARLIRFDYAEQKVEYYPLPGAKGVYGLCEGPDNMIYLGTILGGRLFRFDPFTKNVTDLGSADGEQYVFKTVTGPDGKIYAATYPGAKVIVYDPSTGEMTSLGSMSPNRKYCTAVGVAENGKIFAGIGTPADLVVYDPSTGQKKSLLPEEYKNLPFCDLMAEDNLVYAEAGSRVLFIIDANTLEFLKTIEAPTERGIGMHQDISGGPILINGFPGGNRRYNRTTGELEPCFTPRYSPYDNETGIGYTRTQWRQVFEAYNVTSGQLLARVNVGKDGEGMGIFSIATGPDGCIYGGTESILKLFRYNPSTGVLKDLGFPVVGQGGEIYSFCSYQGKLYMASYSDSYLSVYDPSKPWTPGTSQGSNPRTIGPVGEEQNRPHALTSAADGRIYIGSEPTYGTYGGALSIYDPATDQIEVHRNIIPNETIMSLTTSLDGWTVYGGSSVRGGTGTDPIETKAHFFAWDVREGKKSIDIAWQGTQDIKSLVTAPDGRIYGCAGSTLFIFDPAAGKIVHKQSAREGEIRRMVLWKDGLIYGISDSAIFRFKPLEDLNETIGFEHLYSGGRTIALDDEGRIYFGRGPDLYVLENLPGLAPPTRDLDIYQDGLAQGWNLTSDRATIDLASTEMVQNGRCQSISFDRFCSLAFIPPDPWSITLWKYEALSFLFNPGNSTLRDFVISKTGSGTTDSLSLMRDLKLNPPANQWTRVDIPVEELGWRFGSRLESLNFVILGSGTIYIDSLSIKVPEGFPLLALALAVVLLREGLRGPRQAKNSFSRRRQATCPMCRP